MTKVVDAATRGGDKHAPELIDALVDSYAIETQEFLEKEAENVKKLISIIRDVAKSGEHVVKTNVDKLEIVARNWDKVAQPIQLSFKSRGVDHDPSHEMAYAIRSLAIDLFNEHQMLAQSQRLTSLIQELFAELPEVCEKVQQDVDALDEIFRNRKQSETHKKEWEQEITYRAEVGIIFKDILSISPAGAAWKEKCYPLDSVTRIRWGGVRHSRNGIPTGTTYTVAFGDEYSESVIELKNQTTYSTFIDKLWRAVGVRLLTELLDSLKTGNYVQMGEATIRDDSVVLVKHKFLGSDDLVRCSWGQVHVWSADGAFYIGSQNDKKTYVSLSYIHSPNVHILEHIIRMAFKKSGMTRLSDLLQ